MTQFCSCPRSTSGFKLTKVPGGSGLLNPSQSKALESEPAVLSAPRKPSGCSFHSQPGHASFRPPPQCQWRLYRPKHSPDPCTCVLRTKRLARYLGPNQLSPTCQSMVAFIPLPQFPCLCTTQCLAEMHAGNHSMSGTQALL